MPPKGGEELQAAERHLSGDHHGNVFDDKGPSLSGSKTATFRADDIQAVAGIPQGLRKPHNVVLAEDMPWEHSADGLIKHLVHTR